MKLFAVILASIAALAATVQAYLLWDFTGDADEDKRLKYKLEACSSAIQSLTAIQRLTKDPEGQIARMLEGGGGVTLILSGDDSDDFDTDQNNSEEIRRQHAERLFLYSLATPAMSLQGFVDAQIYFFSENERSKFDLEGIVSAVDQANPYRVYSGNDDVPFEERIARYQKAANQLPAIKDTCLPIMSGS